MAEVARPQPVQVITGVLFADGSVLAAVRSRLEAAVSRIEMESKAYPFNVTGYYADEMGAGLARMLWSFEELISPERIVDIKLATGGIEEAFSHAGRRVVNIDPGYMDFHKLVLASAKFLGQKVYLGRGIYADPTLYYDRGWRTYSWGFPDFRDGRYDGFLTEVRKRYKDKLRGLDRQETGRADEGNQG